MSIKEDVNSYQETDLDHYFIVSSSVLTASIENSNSEQDSLNEENNLDDSENNAEYFDDEKHGDIYINKRLTQKQLNLADFYEKETYRRPKRSNRRKHIRRQIKTKHAKSIEIKACNKQWYMRFRLDKFALLDSSTECYESSYSSNVLSSHTDFHSTRYNHHNNQFQDYIINVYSVRNQSDFDGDMIDILLEMQNRDLSPNDYEILLRLDERIKCKTVDESILDTLLTIDVNETHLNDLCTICMESYDLGQQLKSLPCTHIFHLHCIKKYLKEFSIQCPLDNLPLV
ncbi:unnamed protein product [Rotaria sordida]|uniref:RING-type domain-containing protein n=2 Tax=Rotaria sordida TaxID=392033 RepID=A0A815LA22_9BILA|nr:unnamed protein product [Rotaria sordida]